MAASVLEERLETITREFVRQIVQALRTASFADVASLQTRSEGVKPARARKVTRVSATPAAAKSDRKGPRQTADRRAELGERVLKALGDSEHPLGVRALSSELGVAPDLLAAPLLELRAAGRIAKHGEKRATTYSRA
jgi:predicted Rossmann fold nucleotide-binding protein DprA/Smf involved in DNA uptake